MTFNFYGTTLKFYARFPQHKIQVFLICTPAANYDTGHVNYFSSPRYSIPHKNGHIELSSSLQNNSINIQIKFPSYYV